MRLTQKYTFLLCLLWTGLLAQISHAELNVEFSTYLGGSSDDYGYDIAVDSAHCAYITGVTYSYDFPIQNSYQASFAEGSLDGFVTKLASSGSKVIYSTYFGGSDWEGGFGIAVDSTHYAYVTGYTFSSNFPTKNSYQPSNAGMRDAFVTKFSSSGSSLVFSTYLGGHHLDMGDNIVIDSADCVYLTGHTFSSNFPIKSAFQPYGPYGDSDIFVTKFLSSGSSLDYSTYIGGTWMDFGGSIAVDSDNCAYITGYTGSWDFPAAGGFKGGIYDAYVTKFSSSGSFLNYSVFLGGSGDRESGHGVTADIYGCAYVTGYTESTDFPVQNCYQSSIGGGDDAFITKFSSSGSILHSTYLGGSGYDSGNDIVLNSSGCAYIVGTTLSNDFPTKNPYQAVCAGGDLGDVFITVLFSSGSSLVCSTYIGGNETDNGKGIALDSANCLYITGYTESLDFPTENPYQTNIAGYSDAFVSKLKWEPTPTPISPYIILESGDYNGDGISDIAVFRPATGLWAIRNLSRCYFGGGEDIPISGDYNGDETSDIAVFRSSSGLWAIRNISRYHFGKSGDIPVPGDYDGDGCANIAVFRDGLWALKEISRYYFGSNYDLPVLGDFDGDGSKDTAIFRGNTGLWAIKEKSRLYFGYSGDIPLMRDFDGDGTDEVSIFRANNGLWAIRGISRIYFGASGDFPVPADLESNPSTNICIFRPSSGLWAIRGLSRIYFGGAGDLPVTR